MQQFFDRRVGFFPAWQKKTTPAPSHQFFFLSLSIYEISSAAHIKKKPASWQTIRFIFLPHRLRQTNGMLFTLALIYVTKGRGTINICIVYVNFAVHRTHDAFELAQQCIIIHSTSFHLTFVRIRLHDFISLAHFRHSSLYSNHIVRW